MHCISDQVQAARGMSWHRSPGTHRLWCSVHRHGIVLLSFHSRVSQGLARRSYTPAFHQRLTAVPENAAICALPIDAMTHELAVTVADKTHIGISAPPSSGKTELVAMWTLAFFHFNGNVTWSLAPPTDSHDGHVFYQCRHSNTWTPACVSVEMKKRTVPQQALVRRKA